MVSYLAVWMLAVVGPGAASAPAPWLADYGAALRAARQEGRPLLVVLENPAQEQGRFDLVTLSNSPTEAELLGHYKLCRIDASTPYGQSVARAFGAVRFPYTVIIDRSGASQIFRKTGRFSTSEWQATLARYKQGEQAPVQVQAGYPPYGQAFSPQMFSPWTFSMPGGCST